MHTLSWIILFTLLGGVASVGLGVLLLGFGAHLHEKLLHGFLSYAVGAMLTVALLDLLPHALEHPAVSPSTVTGTLLAGVLLFFILEKLVLWRHCHTEHCAAHGTSEQTAPNPAAAGSLILVGDSIHNFVDGMLIAGAFIADTRLGFATGIAIIAHEIPQEVGDYIILVHSGYSRMKAFLYNSVSSLAAVAGGLAAWFFLSLAEVLEPYLLTLAAASFLYVAVADLIPDLHQRAELGATLQQVLLIVAGGATIQGVHLLTAL